MQSSRHTAAAAVLILAGLLALPATTASAQTLVETVSFDCAGELTGVELTDQGPRATGTVTLTVDLPNGSEWRSAGSVVINLPPGAAGANLAGRKIGRCIGEGQLSAQVTDTINGVDIWSLRLEPTRVRVRIGNRLIQDPDALGFGSTAGGSPNV